MKYVVIMSEPAEEDAVMLLEYLAIHESMETAYRLNDKLDAAFRSLEKLPLRGHRTPELEPSGSIQFREIHMSVYRIIYSVVGNTVTVHTVMDGRRDLQSILFERLMR